MARLTEEMVIARSKQSDLSAIKKLNCWGAELSDVSLLRRMPNVEVLALSINKIRGLSEFASCRRLRELYVRKNDIADLREIRHLRGLPHLIALWLDENPCTQHPEYRMTVLRNLPNLEKLDNVPVHPEEVSEALRRGSHIPDSDDESYTQPPPDVQRRRSSDSSPERDDYGSHAGHVTHAGHAGHAGHTHSGHASQVTTPRTYRDQASDVEAEPAPPEQTPRPDTAQSPDDRYEHPAGACAVAPNAMTRSSYESRARSPDAAAMRHSLSAQSVKEYSYSSNGDCRYGGGGEGRGVASPPYHDGYYERERAESYQQVPSREAWERDSARDVRERERDREYASAVMAEHRGFTRRPVARNSNLLSAVLCLVKELDYPSLEVAEMAVRCRMDELANSQ